jgi:hypothetical protein
LKKLEEEEHNSTLHKRTFLEYEESSPQDYILEFYPHVSVKRAKV